MPAVAERVPPVLLPYQQRWVADKSQVKVYSKSRRIGISWAQAGDDALDAAAEKGTDIWYIGYSKDMAQEYILDAAMWARHYQLAAGEVEEFVFTDRSDDGDKDILGYQIRFASGYRITALSSRPRNLRSKQGRVVIDEAAFHDDLEGLLAAALALLIWGGQVVILSTHFGEDNPFNELVQDIRAGKKDYSLHETNFDDAIAEGFYRRICLVRGIKWTAEGEREWRASILKKYGDRANEELLCIPSRSEGAYFSRALIEARMDGAAPVLRLRFGDEFGHLPDAVRQAEVDEWIAANLQPLIDGLDPAARSYFGMDFGRSGDLSAIVPLVEDQGLVRRAPFIIELRNVPFRQQEQILFHLVDALPRFGAGAMDARGNGQYLAEVAAQRYGATRIQQVMLSAQWYRDNFPKYKAALQDEQVWLPRDMDVLADHRLVTVEKGVPKVPEGAHTKGQDGGQRHGDAAIGCVMAWFANTMDVSVIEYQGTGQVRESCSLDDFLHGAEW